MRKRRPEFVTFMIESVSKGLAIDTSAAFRFNIIDVRPCPPVFAVFPNPTFGNVNLYTLPASEDVIFAASLLDPAGGVLVSANGLR
ncbi:MAG: hypothetical protein MUC38_02930 [Cyclobacteriaceae bacterium]|nr:hypothetical protein [Cyclobacteriaceae bacterium]